MKIVDITRTKLKLQVLDSIKSSTFLREKILGPERLPHPKQPGSKPIDCKRRLKVLKPYMPKHSVGAEIGVFKGSFIDYLLKTEPDKLYCVDPWFRIGSRWEWAVGNKSTVNALIQILDEFKNEINAGILEPRIEFSGDFLTHMPDDSLDWIYIDSSHAYEDTLIELNLAYRKVKASGFIMGDDYDPIPASEQHGVFVAVNELVEAGKFDFCVENEARQFVLKRAI